MTRDFSDRIACVWRRKRCAAATSRSLHAASRPARARSKSWAFVIVSFDLSRSGLNPLRDVKTLLALMRIYRDEAPDLVHHVTIKPVIYGTLASRFAHVPAVVNAIPGMGFVFTQRGPKARVVRGLVNLLYRIALSHDNMRFIFQNREDLQNFVETHRDSRATDASDPRLGSRSERVSVRRRAP